MCLLVYVYVYVQPTYIGAHRSKKGVTGSPESKIQAVVNHLISMLEMKPGYSVIAALLTGDKSLPHPQTSSSFGRTTESQYSFSHYFVLGYHALL